MLNVKLWKWVLAGVLAASVVMGSLFTYFTYGSGTLVIMMEDPPEHWGSASKVYIRYSAIMVHRAEARNESGWSTVTAEGWINLALVLNVSKAIGQGPLQAGKYNIIRFEVAEAVVTVDSKNYTASVSSGKLNIPITRGGIQVNAGQTSYLVIDITPKVTGSPTHGFKLVPAAKATPA